MGDDTDFLYMEFDSDVKWTRNLQTNDNEGTRVRYSLDELAGTTNQVDVDEVFKNCSAQNVKTNATSKEQFRLLLATKMLLNFKATNQVVMYTYVQSKRRNRSWRESAVPTFWFPPIQYENISHQPGMVRIEGESVEVVRLQPDGAFLLLRFEEHAEVWATSLADIAQPDADLIEQYHLELLRMHSPGHGMLLQSYSTLRKK